VGGGDAFGEGELALEAADEGAVVEDLVYFGVGFDEFGAGCELEGGAGFVEVEFGGCGAAYDGHAGVSGEGGL